MKLSKEPNKDRQPESLKQILGALVFAADHPVTLRELQTVLRETRTQEGEDPSPFAGIQPSTLRAALLEIRDDLVRLSSGIELVEVAGGFRMQTRPVCSAWIRKFLCCDRPGRLSQPALETLAVIAYRQPIPRADIERIRGVAVGHVLKNLVELSLIKIAGRSDLPGKPFLYGTTSAFLEYFGLESLHELDKLDPSLRAVRTSLRQNGNEGTSGEDAEPRDPGKKDMD